MRSIDHKRLIRGRELINVRELFEETRYFMRLTTLYQGIIHVPITLPQKAERNKRSNHKARIKEVGGSLQNIVSEFFFLRLFQYRTS